MEEMSSIPGKSLAVPERYSLNPAFISQAHSLYCKGFSLTKVAEALRPEWPEVSARTLQRIAKEMGWEASRATYQRYVQDSSVAVEGMTPEIIFSLQQLRMRFESQGALNAIEVAQYRGLCEDIMMYTGKHPKLQKQAGPLAISGNMEIAALLEAIQEDEVLGAAWKRRKLQVTKAYQAKLGNSKPKTKAPKKSK